MTAEQGPPGIEPRDEVDELFDAARSLAARSAGDERVDWPTVRRYVRRRRAARTAAWAVSTAVVAGAAVWLVQAGRGGATPGESTTAASPPVLASPSPDAPEYRLLLPEPRVRVVADRHAELGALAAAEVELRSGTLRVAVDASAGPVPFVVRTPVARVAVLGTRFGVRHDASGTSVAVLQGRVRVAGPSGERVLEAGSEGSAGGGSRPLGEAWRADLVRTLGPTDTVGPDEGRLAAAVPALPPPGPPPPPLPSSPATVVPPTPAEPSVGPEPEPSGEELYRQAETAMAVGRLEEAVALLERVAEQERGRTLGGTALIDLAARYRRLGQTTDAADACRRYLQEHPAGTFRGEARVTLCRLERQSGGAAAARACYAAYLEELPDGPYADEARAGAEERVNDAP